MRAGRGRSAAARVPGASLITAETPSSWHSRASTGRSTVHARTSSPDRTASRTTSGWASTVGSGRCSAASPLARAASSAACGQQPTSQIGARGSAGRRAAKASTTKGSNDDATTSRCRMPERARAARVATASAAVRGSGLRSSTSRPRPATRAATSSSRASRSPPGSATERNRHQEDDATGAGTPATRSRSSSWQQTATPSAVSRTSISTPSAPAPSAAATVLPVFSGADPTSCPRCPRISMTRRWRPRATGPRRGGVRKAKSRRSGRGAPPGAPQQRPQHRPYAARARSPPVPSGRPGRTPPPEDAPCGCA